MEIIKNIALFNHIAFLHPEKLLKNFERRLEIDIILIKR